MSPPLSVVVPTRDRPDLLAGCLAALTAALRPGDELIVVDSASRGTRTGEAARTAGAACLRADRPGASYARNLGWRAAGRRVVAFVDDDVRVEPGWAAALAAAFADPVVGFVTGRVGVPPAQAGVVRPVAVKDDPHPHPVDADTRGTVGASANLAVRRDALAAVAGFDERLGPGTRAAAAEDLDLFDRLLAAGYRGRYEPAARAVHEQWRSRPALLRLDFGYGVGAGVRLARLARRDRRRAAALAAEALWGNGLRVVAGDLRRRYEFGALTTAVRMLGTLVGLLAATAPGRRR